MNTTTINTQDAGKISDINVAALAKFNTILAEIAKDPTKFDAIARLAEYDAEEEANISQEAIDLARKTVITDNPSVIMSLGSDVLSKYRQTGKKVFEGVSLGQLALTDENFAKFYQAMTGIDLRRAIQPAGCLARIIPALDPMRATVKSMTKAWQFFTELEVSAGEQKRQLVKYRSHFEVIDVDAKEAYPLILKYAAVLQHLYNRENSELDTLADRAGKSVDASAQGKYQRQNMIVTAIKARQAAFSETASRLWVVRTVVTNAWGVSFTTETELGNMIDLYIPDLQMNWGITYMNAYNSKVLNAATKVKQATRESMVIMTASLLRNVDVLRNYLLEDKTQLKAFEDAINNTVIATGKLVNLRAQYQLQVQEFEANTGAMAQAMNRYVKEAHETAKAVGVPVAAA